MKTRFSTIDISVMIKELKRFLGMRVANVYDIDNKTYLIRIQKPDQKAVILLESGIRIHSTEFDWPKNPAPSGFSMKMRKHLKGRRFESITQLGIDRIVDLQFGSSEAAYHIILELYDRGNIVLTDYEYNILNILRPRTDTSQEVCYAVRERYPLEAAKQHEVPTKEKLQQIILSGKEGDPLKKMLIPNLDYGPALLDHCLKGVGFSENIKLGKGFNIAEDMTKLMLAIEEAEQLLEKLKSEHTKGFVIQKKDQRPVRKEQDSQDIIIYEEFHPLLMRQHENKLFSEFETFDRAVDEFFSKVESQKLDMKTLQQEKAALKKLENVKKDHEKRICDLQKEQEIDVLRGQLIEMNLSLVDQALLRVRSAVANQIDWTEIWKLIKEAQLINDPVACAIRSVCLDTNQITLLLSDPYEDADDEDSEYEPIKPLRVTLDLSLGAYANSRKYFEKKKLAAKKEQKTVDASTKAIKSAQKKAKQTLKEVAIIASINKTRKTFWFEKFLWFISSENYLVIGGRDQQQNELIVKRYLKPGDLYVHADLHGASSCIIKNPSGEPVPPKTLNEAGTMAICNSAAWDAKVVTSAWYVYHDQVSKTAPSGEYLTTGSFMVRGKKNYLPPSYLIYGFAYIFKLEDGSIFRHKGERKVRSVEDEEKDTVKEIVVSVEQKDECEEKKESENCDVKTESDTCSSSECFVHKSSVDLNSDSLNEVTADITEQEDKVETDDSETSESEKHSDEDTKDVFPDTYINLMHVAGDKFELKRDVRTSNTDDDLNDEGNRIIFLGDNQPVTIGKKCVNKGTKLSARQSRKGKREQSFNDDEDNVSWLKQEQTEKKEEEKQKLACTKPEIAVQQPKRGQRGRRKKIKEKYRDQDDEERQLRMEILASAGAEKEVVSQKGKKGKNSKNVQINKQQEKKATKDFQKPGESTNRQTECQDKIDKSTDVSLEGSATQVDEEDQEKKISSSKNTKKPANNEALDSDEEKVDDNLPSTNDTDILDSLTGCPLPEDEILYAIPMCAPYSCLINYKYKVKLLPGNTKRGKAAKTAINMFLQEKSGSSREKDLLRIMKDVDVSRNIPGKVKLAAPNLHKTKK